MSAILREHTFSQEEISIYISRQDKTLRINNLYKPVAFVHIGVVDDDTYRRYVVGYALTLCRKYVGITSELDGDIAKKTARMICEHYGDMNLDEIEAAFDAAMLGKLPDLPHYNSFSVRYVLSVLNSYLRYRSAIVIKANNILNVPEITEEQKTQFHYLFLNKMLERFDNVIKLDFMFDPFYTYTFPSYADYIEKHRGFTVTAEKEAELQAEARDIVVTEVTAATQKGGRENRRDTAIELRNISENTWMPKTESRAMQIFKTLKVLEQLTIWNGQQTDYYQLINNWEGLK